METKSASDFLKKLYSSEWDEEVKKKKDQLAQLKKKDREARQNGYIRLIEPKRPQSPGHTRDNDKDEDKDEIQSLGYRKTNIISTNQKKSSRSEFPYKKIRRTQIENKTQKQSQEIRFFFFFVFTLIHNKFIFF